MSELSYQMMRTANQVREADESRTNSRKKNLLLLVMHYLSEEGFVESANSLSRETNLDFKKYEVCDNVDLETVLMEYESYYYIKFQKYPKVTKKLPEDIKAKYRMNAPLPGQQSKTGKGQTGNSGSTTFPRLSQTQNSQRNPGPQTLPSSATVPSMTALVAPERPRSGPRRQGSQRGPNGEDVFIPLSNGKKKLDTSGNDSQSDFTYGTVDSGGQSVPLVIHGRQDIFSLMASQQPPPSQPLPDNNGKGNGVPRRANKGGPIIDYRAMINQETRLNVEEDSRNSDPSDRLLKPLGSYLGYNSEWRELAMTISRDIYLTNPNVRWSDIIGLDAAKRLVKEAVVYPIKYPQLFTGILSPWKGLLLYGPPGTGKTMLAKAVATECNTTFFNISASSIVSKWRGDSEKLVRVLFELARFHAPSTIFVDELDSLMSQRGSGGGSEHEGSRRMKTELLVQMDGLSKSDDLVFLLAASNLPWELDHAMLRRLEKRILVGLPTVDARRQLFMNFLPAKPPPGNGQSLELRTAIDYDRCAEITEGYSGSDIQLVCKEAAMRVVRKIFDALESYDEEESLQIKLDRVTTADIESALRTTKPSTKSFATKYDEWEKEFASV